MCSTMTVLLVRHNSNYGECNQGKQRIKRYVLRRLRKTDSDAAEGTCCGGRLFQTRAVEEGSSVHKCCWKESVYLLLYFCSALN